MGKITKLIGGGIGLVSEAISNHKTSGGRQQSPQHLNGESSESNEAGPSSDLSANPPAYDEVTGSRSHAKLEKQAEHEEKEIDEDDSLSEEEDEEDWALDEAARPTEVPKDTEPKDSDEVANRFIRTHPLTCALPAGTNLSCPVIIPQRRPRDNARGFVRAYAPVLEDHGIDQASFLDFLESFQLASKASPWLDVVNLAALGAQLTPSLIAKGASVAVRVTAGVAIAAQRASRSHSFLDRMNKEYFQPRGLYCLVITYKPDSSKSHAPLDISRSLGPSGPVSEIHTAMRKLRVSSSTINGQLEMPEAAPLIFPHLDALANGTTKEDLEKSHKITSTKAFVADYMDRRAQARFTGQNPGTTLPGEQPSFVSRYADPNSSTNTGGLLSFATGGMVNPREGKRRRPVRNLLAEGGEYLKGRKGEGSREKVQNDGIESPQSIGARETFGGPLGRRAGESRGDRRDRVGRQGVVKRVLQK
ncbi:hypothetical protein HYFRA_00000589, partial [Hymenoscyphus fraxineus]